MKLLLAIVFALVLAGAAYVSSRPNVRGEQPLPRLEGRAVLPARTFAPGPPSGSALVGPFINGEPVPFPAQPVQGISALIKADNETYWAMADNGFGAKENSADFLLRAYRVRLDFETDKGGPGTVAIRGFMQFRDPDHMVTWNIVNGATADRNLTGADFDIESIRQDAKGDFWVGDEFGPFILHFDATGKLLEAPILLPGVKSPQNPTLAAGETPNLPRSRGFEGMAISPDGKTLIPTLEGALVTDPDQRRRFFFEFDTGSRSYTGKTWQYHMDGASFSFGDVTGIDANRLLVIERDGGQGVTAVFKKIFVVDLRQLDAQDFLIKRPVLDLLQIQDPDLISLPSRAGDIGLGSTFSFPFETIESVLPLSSNTLLIANDNNYPFSTGRNRGRPDDNEFIVVRVDTLSGN